MERDYQTLKLKPGATLEEIKQAYKKQAKEWHPDRFPANNEKLQQSAHKMFHQITAAYTRLEAWHTNGPWRKHTDRRPGYSGFGGDHQPADDGWEENTSKDIPQINTRTWANGDKYEGMIVNDMMHGRGIFTYANGNVYTGEFKFGKMEGLGKLVFSNGDTYSGEFREDQFHGQGKMFFGDGERYMGSFANGQYHGQGVFVTQGKVYAGQWEYGSLRADPPWEGF